MKAFLVKYHGCTNTLPSRWSVKCEGQKQEFYHIDDGGDICNLVRRYANAHLSIDGDFTLVQGTLPNGDIAVVFV
jgi:hypothetical protein